MFYQKETCYKNCNNEKISIFAFRQRIKSANWHGKETVVYQKVVNTYEFDKIVKKKTNRIIKYNGSNLIENSKYRFYEYYNIKNFNSLSLTSNIPFYSRSIAI